MARPGINIKALFDLAAFRTSSQQLQKELRKAGKGMQNAGMQMTKAFTLPIVALGALSVKAAADFETLKVSLKTSLGGSAEAAEAAFSQIQKFAARTPFQLEEVAQAFIKLKNMGLNPSEAALTSYGDTASAMGHDLNKMVDAVASATVGEFERLKEFGIKAKSEGDKVSFIFRGVTTTVGKNATEIENYLRGIGETEFAGGMEAQSQTLNGVLSTLRDNFQIAAASFGELMLPALKALSGAMLRFSEILKSLSPGAKKVIIVIGGLVAAIGPLLIGLGAMTAAMGALSTASLPIVGVIALIVSAALQWAAVIIYVRKNQEAFADFFSNLWIRVKNTFIEAIKGMLSGYKWLLDVFKIDFGEKVFQNLDKLKGNVNENAAEFGSFRDAFLEVKEDVKNGLNDLMGTQTATGENTATVTDEMVKKWKKVRDEFVKVNQEIAESVHRTWRKVFDFEIRGQMKKLADDMPGMIDYIKTNAVPKFAEVGIEIGKAFGDALRGMLNDMAVLVGETLGNIMSGDYSAGDFGKQFLAVIGDFMAQFGKAIIAIGIAKLTLDEAITTGNAPLAIAAGVALVAAGKVLSNIQSRGINMNGSGGSVGSGITAAGSYSGSGFGSGSMGMIQTQTVISGREMIITQQGEREFTRRRNRDTLFRK